MSTHNNGTATELAHAEVIIPEPGMAVALARAEIDQQISTARAYPRSIDRAMKNILTLATLDEETAEECIYALPRGGKPIKGPSVRLAEIIVSQWGNNRASARVVHVDRVEKFVEAEGVFHDLETNTATCARVRRRISDKYNKVYSDDMIIVTGNAACSIAKRNAILGGVPKGVWRRAYEHAERVIAGTAETLVVTREKTMKAFAAFGVVPERVCVAIGVGGLDDIKIEHIPVLRGMYSAIKNGEATVEEMFSDNKSAPKPSGPVDIPEPEPEKAATKAEASPAPAEPEKKPDTPTEKTKPRATKEKKAATADDLIRKIEDEIAQCESEEEFDGIGKKHADAIAAFSAADQARIYDVLNAATE